MDIKGRFLPTLWNPYKKLSCNQALILAKLLGACITKSLSIKATNSNACVNHVIVLLHATMPRVDQQAGDKVSARLTF